MESDPNLKDNPFRGLGAVVAPAMIDKFVTTLVTPESLARLINAHRANDQGKDQNSENFSKETEWVDLDNFQTHITNSANSKRVTLTFKRAGFFGWKLSRIDLPLDGFAQNLNQANAAENDPEIVDVCVGHYIGSSNDGSSKFSIDITNRPIEIKILFSDYGNIKAVDQKIVDAGVFEFTDYDDKSHFTVSCHGDTVNVKSQSTELTAQRSNAQLEMSGD
ncbi:MAG: hypothetical protein ABI898_02195 [Sphingomonadales bacterium]